MIQQYKAIGLMSGSSLDGVDIAYCTFTKEANQWTFDLLQTSCVPFPERWINRLKFLPLQSALTYFKTHTYFGHYLGEITHNFIKEHNLSVDLIASHGHTVFHEPHNRLTAQVGDGAAIAEITGITTVTQLRTNDVALAGQGAPIVPIGDLHLFPDYRFCLNLGGIANISVKTKERIVAFDICGCNQILNRLVEEIGLVYDEDGLLARKGQVNAKLLQTLNTPAFFKKKPPKSLSNQWVIDTMMGIIEQSTLPVEDLLSTFCEHVAFQIAHVIQKYNPLPSDKLLVTGGGAFNIFLMERIVAHLNIKVVIPDKDIVAYKEAMVMAFMGVLRLRNEVNVLSSVTGAKRNSVCGLVSTVIVDKIIKNKNGS